MNPDTISDEDLHSVILVSAIVSLIAAPDNQNHTIIHLVDSSYLEVPVSIADLRRGLVSGLAFITLTKEDIL